MTADERRDRIELLRSQLAKLEAEEQQSIHPSPAGATAGPSWVQPADGAGTGGAFYFCDLEARACFWARGGVCQKGLRAGSKRPQGPDGTCADWPPRKATSRDGDRRSTPPPTSSPAMEATGTAGLPGAVQEAQPQNPDGTRNGADSGDGVEPRCVVAAPGGVSGPGPRGFLRRALAIRDVLADEVKP